MTQELLCTTRASFSNVIGSTSFHVLFIKSGCINWDNCSTSYKRAEKWWRWLCFKDTEFIVATNKEKLFLKCWRYCWLADRAHGSIWPEKMPDKKIQFWEEALHMQMIMVMSFSVKSFSTPKCEIRCGMLYAIWILLTTKNEFVVV